jgi:hypothetical protein
MAEPIGDGVTAPYNAPVIRTGHMGGSWGNSPEEQIKYIQNWIIGHPGEEININNFSQYQSQINLTELAFEHFPDDLDFFSESKLPALQNSGKRTVERTKRSGLQFNGLPYKNCWSSKELAVDQGKYRPGVFEVYITVNEQCFLGLIDTGAEFSSCRQDLLDLLRLPKLGVGDVIETWGMGGKIEIVDNTVIIPVLHDLKFKPLSCKVNKFSEHDYPVILARDFLMDNALIVDPFQLMVGKNLGNDAYWCLFTNSATNECRRIISGVPVYSRRPSRPGNNYYEQLIEMDFDEANISFVKKVHCSCSNGSHPTIGDLTDLNNSIVISNLADSSMLPCPDFVTTITNPCFYIPNNLNHDGHHPNPFKPLKKGSLIGKAYSIICPVRDALSESDKSLDWKNPVGYNANLQDTYHTSVYYDHRRPPLYEVNKYDVDDLPPSNSWTKEELNSKLQIHNKDPFILKNTQDLLWEYKDVFSMTDHTAPAKLHPMKINLKDDSPIFIAQYKRSAELDAQVEQECKKMLAAGLIEESHSKFNFPLLAVKKPNGKIRLVLDLRKLNLQAIPYSFPLLDITQALSMMHGFNHFTSLDLTQGFF